MKIVLAKGARPAQFSATPVVCSDKKMAEVLAANHRYPTNSAAVFLESIKNFRSGKTSYFEYCFRSGAKLKIKMGQKNFFIYSYSSDGKDGLAAIEELRMLESLRAAFAHLAKHDAILRGSRKVVDPVDFGRLSFN